MTVYRGLGVYQAAANWLAKCRTWPKGKQLAPWVLGLAEHRTLCEEFLDELAGKQSQRFHNRLRLAAALYHDERSDPLDELYRLLAKRRSLPIRAAMSRAQDLIGQAERFATAAHCTLVEAVGIGMNLSTSVISALQEDPALPLSGPALNELVYLARAGIEPLRRLAVWRLSGSDRPRAVATLMQFREEGTSM